MRIIIIALAFGITSLLTNSLFGQSRDELAKLVRDREDALSQWTVEVEINRRDRRPPRIDTRNIPRSEGVPVLGAAPDWIHVSVIELITYSSPKWSVKSMRSSDFEVIDTTERRAFDGSVASQLSGTPTQWGIGTISTRPTVPSESLMYFLGLYDLPYSKMVADETLTIKAINGRLSLESPVRQRLIDGAEFEEKGTLFFDANAGYAPVRSEANLRRKGDQKWRLVTVWEVEKFHQEPSGVSLPTRVVVEEYLPNTAEGDDVRSTFELFSRAEIELRNWSIGSIPIDHKFRVAFPPNIHVDDERTGKRLQANELSDW
jgi:hypothetical protein